MGRSEKGRERNKKDLDKDRKTRKNRKYGQGSRKHSKRGVLSCMTAAGIIILLTLLLISTYFSKGSGSVFVGLLGLLSLFFSWVGLVLGIRGFREREKNYVTCKIGTVFNGLLVLIFVAVFVRGLI